MDCEDARDDGEIGLMRTDTTGLPRTKTSRYLLDDEGVVLVKQKMLKCRELGTIDANFAGECHPIELGFMSYGASIDIP
ncbi:MAG: hypothetical protein KJ718_03845 [Nanoarchaeota archaeon]|nr:hypothetical protein [Nanoarchaeota archaeon]